MHLKKWLALLVSAALALALLAGCGNGGKALSRVFVDLLEGQYQNLSVQTDSKLEAALKLLPARNDAPNSAQQPEACP